MFTRLKQRLEARAIASLIIVPLVFCVVAFLAIACFLALLEHLGGALSALVTAAAGIVLIALFLLVTRIATRPPSAPAQGRDEFDPGRTLEALLQEHADPVLSAWIRDNPDRAMVATLLLGVAAGYSDSVRRALLDLYSHYAAAEAQRRDDRPAD